MDKPFAITLDVGSSLANKTGSWRTERPVYVDRLPPCNHACPAGENIQGWLYHAESGDYEAAWRALTRGQPAARGHGARLLPPLRDRLQPRRSSTRRSASTRSSASSATRRSSAAGSSTPPARESGKRVLVVGAGPVGPVGRLPPARGSGHAVTILEAGPLAGGMMRFGIPKYRLPRDVLDAEVQRILDLGVELELNTQGRRTSSTTMQDGRLRRRLPRRRRAHRQARLHPGRRARRGSSTRSSVLRSMEGEDKPMLGRRVVVYGGGNTALDVARTAKRLGATEAIIVYRRTREKMPAHDFEVEEALQEGVLIKWLSTIKNMADEGTLTVEKMALDDKGFPQPTGEFETLEADSLVLALGQDVDLSLLDGVPGLEIKDGVVQVGAEHDDRARRASSPAATWCRPSAP